MSVATSYARALYEAVQGTSTNGGSDLSRRHAAAQEELTTFCKLIESNKPLRVALLGPAASAKEKASILTEIAQKSSFSELVKRFLILLVKGDRLRAVSDIASALDEIRVQGEGGVLGEVVSADGLSPKDLDALAAAFGKKLGKPVKLRSSEDPTLLAGLKVTVNGVTYDGSLRAQIDRLREAFVRPPSRH